MALCTRWSAVARAARRQLGSPGGRGDGRGEVRAGRHDRRHDAHDAIARHLAHGRLGKVASHVPEFQVGSGWMT